MRIYGNAQFVPKSWKCKQPEFEPNKEPISIQIEDPEPEFTPRIQKNSQEVYAVSIKTGEVIGVFPSGGEAERIMKCGHCSASRISGNKALKIGADFTFRKPADYRKNEAFKNAQGVSIPLIGEREADGKKLWFREKKEVCNFVDSWHSVISSEMSRNGSFAKDGWIFKVCTRFCDGVGVERYDKTSKFYEM